MIPCSIDRRSGRTRRSRKVPPFTVGVAAYDSNIVAVRPDYIIEVRQDVLDEEDGPMLKHGLVELHKKQIILPSPVKLSPDKHLLEKRYEEFRAAG